MHNLNKNQVLGFIPARGGSKSVPLKNISPLNGRPLIEYCIKSAQSVMPDTINRLICSTDHEKIEGKCKELRVETIQRPSEYADDVAPVEAAMRHCLQVLHDNEGSIPEIIILFQPTSPFILKEHIIAIVELLKNNFDLDTAQTVSTIPHNLHALNQRVILENGHVKFKYEEDRLKAYNKLLKPSFYKFGNIVACKSNFILNGNTCFSGRCGHHMIDSCYAHDVDGAEDFEYAEYLINRKKVCLEYINNR